MIIGLQIVAFLFSLLMIYFALIHYKKNVLNKVEIGAWVFIWIVTILFVLFPSTLESYVRVLPFSRLFDLLTVGGFILVISLTSASYIKTKKLEQKFRDFIRQRALKNSKLK
jgi:hypothetical protein